MATPSEVSAFSHEHCLALLARASLGRVSVSVRALPEIVVVRYAVDGGRILLQPADGTLAGRGLDRAVIAFEADGYDDDAARLWSVLGIGVAEPVGRGPRPEVSETFQLRPVTLRGHWVDFA